MEGKGKGEEERETERDTERRGRENKSNLFRREMERVFHSFETYKQLFVQVTNANLVWGNLLGLLKQVFFCQISCWSFSNITLWRLAENLFVMFNIVVSREYISRECIPKPCTFLCNLPSKWPKNLIIVFIYLPLFPSCLCPVCTKGITYNSAFYLKDSGMPVFFSLLKTIIYSKRAVRQNTK